MRTTLIDHASALVRPVSTSRAVGWGLVSWSEAWAARISSLNSGSRNYLCGDGSLLPPAVVEQSRVIVSTLTVRRIREVCQTTSMLPWMIAPGQQARMQGTVSHHLSVRPVGLVAPQECGYSRQEDVSLDLRCHPQPRKGSLQGCYQGSFPSRSLATLGKGQEGSENSHLFYS